MMYFLGSQLSFIFKSDDLKSYTVEADDGFKLINFAKRFVFIIVQTIINLI